MLNFVNYVISSVAKQYNLAAANEQRGSEFGKVTWGLASHSYVLVSLYHAQAQEISTLSL